MKLETECFRLQSLYESSAQVKEEMESQLKQCRGKVVVSKIDIQHLYFCFFHYNRGT